MSDLTLAEIKCLQQIMNPDYRGREHLIVSLAESLESKGFCHIVREGDRWCVAQTPEEASAARCLLIPGYKPIGGPEWFADLEKLSSP